MNFHSNRGPFGAQTAARKLLLQLVKDEQGCSSYLDQLKGYDFSLGGRKIFEGEVLSIRSNEPGCRREQIELIFPFRLIRT